jgi:hypothetical protein
MWAAQMLFTEDKMRHTAQAILCTIAFFGALSPVIAPMARVSGKYDLHLFPKDDAVTYKPSQLQRDSQNLHIAAGVSLAFAVLFNFANLALRTRTANRSIALASYFSVLISSALYIAAVGTLIAVVHRVKDNLDKVPIPIPDVHVEPAAGTYLDGIGLLAAFSASVLSVYALITGGRDNYQELA